MKHFNKTFLCIRLRKSLILTVLSLGVCFASHAQVYKANLSGSNEAPPNSSPGSGVATITIDGTNMRVQSSFTGLTGITTVCHIHAATAIAGVGTAGVATSTPLFPGFPIGVTSGSYDRTFDMTLASSYNAVYITNNGGTTATAFAALKAAMNDGKSYFNLHSNVFPGGEIRGFLILCPTIAVNIADAFALAQGVLANTVYPAYAPAASITLETSINGGTAPYTYNWSSGSVTSTATVSPVVATQYSVTVMDKNGCSGAAVKTVNVADIAGGKKGDKIIICHKGKNSLTIDGGSVADHLAHGDMLGSCAETSDAAIGLRNGVIQKEAGTLAVRVYQNPSPNYFDLKISGKDDGNIQLRVFDLRGRNVEIKVSVKPNSMVRLGTALHPGTYIVEIIQGNEKQILKLIKQ